MNFLFCQPTFSARFTNSFSAKSFGSLKAIRRESKTNRKSKKRAAFIIRQVTSLITSLRTRSANCWKTKHRNKRQNFALSILLAVPARSSSPRINTCSIGIAIGTSLMMSRNGRLVAIQRCIEESVANGNSPLPSANAFSCKTFSAWTSTRRQSRSPSSRCF